MPKKKQTSNDWKGWVIPLTVAIVVLGLTYAVVSWAIDSGRILAYILTFVGLYFGLHYLKEAVKNFLK